MGYSATYTVTVRVTCDHCAAVYKFDRECTGGGSDEARAILDAEQVVERLTNSELTWLAEDPYYVACPKCGYVQPWMVEQARKSQLENVGGGVGCRFFLTYVAAVIMVGLAQAHEVLGEGVSAGVIGGILVVGSIVTLVVRRTQSKPFKHSDWPLEEWLQTNEPPLETHLPEIIPHR
jgi:hypothetical protein